MNTTSRTIRSRFFFILVALGQAVCLSPAFGDQCPIQVKHCIDPSIGTIDILVFNGDDTSHMVPATSAINQPYDTVVDLSCNHALCDVQFKFSPRDPFGSVPPGSVWDHDGCHHLTATRNEYGAWYIAPALNSCQ